MATKLKSPKVNGKPDNRFLDREVLERELVCRDKQALISDCLKIFDTNTLLFEQVRELTAQGLEDKARINGFKKEIERLNARSLWAILNERIQWRIDRMKAKRTKTPTT